MLDALATAGGESFGANLTKVRVIHRSNREKPDSTLVDVKKILSGVTNDVTLHDGDTVYVDASDIGPNGGITKGNG